MSQHAKPIVVNAQDEAVKIYSPSNYHPRAASVKAQNEAALESLEETAPRPIMVDRWTTEFRRSYPHPALQQDAIVNVRQQDVDEDGEDVDVDSPQGGADEEIVDGKAVGGSASGPGNYMVDRAVVTRSSGAQTRPPFCAYNPDTFNHLVPRPVREEKGEMLVGGKRGPSSRKASPVARVVEEKPEETTSREIGSGKTNHVVSKRHETPPRERLSSASTSSRNNGGNVQRSTSAPTRRSNYATVRVGANIDKHATENARSTTGPVKERPPSARGRSHNTSTVSVGSGKVSRGTSGSRNHEGRTMSRRYFSDSSTQTAEDPLKVNPANAGMSGRTLFTTNLFLCPSCHAVLRSNATKASCQRCGSTNVLPLFTCQQVNAPGHFPVKGVVLAEGPKDSVPLSPPRSRPASATRRTARSPSPAAKSTTAECLHWFD